MTPWLQRIIILFRHKGCWRNNVKGHCQLSYWYRHLCKLYMTPSSQDVPSATFVTSDNDTINKKCLKCHCLNRGELHLMKNMCRRCKVGSCQKKRRVFFLACEESSRREEEPSRDRHKQIRLPLLVAPLPTIFLLPRKKLLSLSRSRQAGRQAAPESILAWLRRRKKGGGEALLLFTTFPRAVAFQFHFSLQDCCSTLCGGHAQNSSSSSSITGGGFTRLTHNLSLMCGGGHTCAKVL